MSTACWCSNHIELPAPLIDMGSGPGLPGIPLKIARPEVPMILAEPRGARAAFLREVCDELGLKDVEVYAHKVGIDYPGQVGGVITRAVGVDPGDARPRGVVSGAGRPDDLHEGPRVRSRDRRGRADARRGVSAWRPITRIRFPAPTTAGGWSSTSDWKERPVESHSRFSSKEGAGSAAFGGTIREITSDSNPTFQRCHDLLRGPGIRKHGEAILAGTRVCSEVLARFPERVLGWLTGTAGPAAARRFDHVASLERPALQAARRRGDARTVAVGQPCPRCLPGPTTIPGRMAARCSSRFRTRKTSGR